METHISATELAKRLSDVLSRARYRGERFVVERGGEPVAVLEPPDGVSRAATLRELAKRLGEIRPDDAFADDLEAVQEGQPMAETSRW